MTVILRKALRNSDTKIKKGEKTKSLNSVINSSFLDESQVQTIINTSRAEESNLQDENESNVESEGLLNITVDPNNSGDQILVQSVPDTPLDIGQVFFDFTRHLSEKFRFTNLGVFLKKAINKDKNVFIDLMSHEVFKLKQDVNGEINSNIQFLSKDSVQNNDFLNLKINEIDKYESLSERLFVYLDYNIHHDAIKENYENVLQVIDLVDDISLVDNKLKNEINYGNIVEKFVKNGVSKYNGKILSDILSYDPGYYLNTLTSSSKKSLLDKQDKTVMSVVSTSDLSLFYEDINNFKLSERNENFLNSLLNFKIVNSDRFVGQLMVNYAISQNSLYPNSDVALKHLSWPTTVTLREDRSREADSDRVNSSALNRFPIIKVKDLNNESRIFGKSNLEILSFNGKKLNTHDIKLNYDLDSENRIIRDFIDDFSPYYPRLPSALNINNRLIDKRISLAGKSSKTNDSQGTTEVSGFMNNVFNILYQPSVFSGQEHTNDLLYETIFIDSTTEDTVAFENAYLSNSYLVLPNRLLNAGARAVNTDLRLNKIVNQLNMTEAAVLSNDNFNDVGVEFLNKILGLNAFNSINSNTRTIFIASFIKDYINPRYKAIYNKYKENIVNNRHSLSYNAVLRLEGDYIECANLLDNLLTEFSIESGNTNVEVDGVRSSNVSGKIFESLKQTYSFDVNFKRKDCFVYKTSNSFLTFKDLSNISRSYFKNLDSINKNTKVKESLSYIKTNQEKLVNKTRINESLDNLRSETKGNDRIDNICLTISSAINIAKKSMSEKSDIFDGLLKKVKNKLSENESFTLLYGDKNETCLEVFKESKFINFNEEKSYYKNNFSESFDDKVLNSMSIILDESKDLENDHIFTSSEYRNYLSKIYTNSFLKDKTSLLARIISDNIDIYNSNKNYERELFLGFDILLAKSLLNDNNNNTDGIKDICKLILANAVARISDFKKSITKLTEKNIPMGVNNEGKNVSNYEGFNFNKNIRSIFGDNKINSIINCIYSQKNVKSVIDIENRILRSTKFDIRSNSLKKLNLSSLNDSRYESGFDFKIVDGYLVEFLFPMVDYISQFEDSNLNPDGRLYSSDEIDNSVIEKRILSAVSNSFYNYDIFTNDDSTGIVYFEDESDDESGESFKVAKGFTYDTGGKDFGTDLKISYFRHSKTSLNQNVDTPESLNDLKIPYTAASFYIPFSYFYLAENQETFSGKLTNIAVDLLKVFEEEFDSFNTFDDVLSFVENNTSYIEILQNIYEIHSLLFLQSYENYKEIIVENIRDKLVDEDENNNDDIIRYIKAQNKFVGGVMSNKSLAVSDIELLLDSINTLLENPRYVQFDNIFGDSGQEGGSRLLIGSRAKVMQSVTSILRNSDISDAICHDMIHGYFYNFEDNIAAEQNDALTLNSSINSLNQAINSVEGLETFDIKSRILNEFYQNVLSKNLQETLYYKNLLNEIFVKNNLFNSVKEKYESLNIYNQLKVYNESMYNRGIDAAKFISRTSQRLENIDILKIPLSYDLVNKIGEKGIIQVSVLPVNLKFPEIEYKQLSFFYTPFLTEVTSNFYSDISSNFYDYIGMYNSSQKTTERYNVVSGDIAISEVRRIIEEVFIRSAELLGEDIDFDIDFASEKTVFDAKISSAIKALDFISQGHLNSNIKEEEFTFENLVSGKAIKMVNSVSIDNLSKVFENFKNDIDGFEDEGIFDISTNTSIYENNEFYKKFLNRLSKDMSEIDIIEDMLPTINYDVFGFVINKNTLQIVDSNEELETRGIIVNSSGVLSPNENKSFNYYIEIKVL